MPRCQIPAILHIKRKIKLSINISASSDQICAVLGLFKSSKLGLSSDIVSCDLAEWMAQNCFTKFVLHIFNYICIPPITNNTIYGSRINISNKFNILYFSHDHRYLCSDRMELQIYTGNNRHLSFCDD